VSRTPTPNRLAEMEDVFGDVPRLPTRRPVIADNDPGIGRAIDPLRLFAADKPFHRVRRIADD
jgi:hypothetical protein